MLCHHVLWRLLISCEEGMCHDVCKTRLENLQHVQNVQNPHPVVFFTPHCVCISMLQMQQIWQWRERGAN